MANIFFQARVAAAAFLVGSLIVSSGCSGSDDDAVSDEAPLEGVVDDWIVAIPEPPIANKITSNVTEDSLGKLSASWAGSVTIGEWPGTGIFLDGYDAAMSSAGLERGSRDEDFPVAGNTRRIVTYASDAHVVTVTITETDAVVGVVVGVQPF